MSLKKQLKKLMLPVACKTVLAPKSFSKIPEDALHINCGKEQAEIMSETSNNVIRIIRKDGNLYFRECRLQKNARSFVMDEIAFYYTEIHPELGADRKFLEEALSDKENFKKFLNMGMTNDISSGVYQFCMGNGGKNIGLECSDPEQEERLIDFAQYIWGTLFAYTLNSGVKKGRYQTYNAVRCIASRRMAEILGLEELIPETSYAEISIDGKNSLFGTVMKESPGKCMEKMSRNAREEVCSPALQKALGRLNILDVLCLEKDHRAGNFNVVTENGKAVSVSAFDNDSPKSFGIGGISFRTYAGCSPWAKDGKLNRPFVEKALAERILRIDEKEVCNRMKDLLNFFQLLSLKYRIKQMKKVLASLPDEKLLEEEEWSEETLKEELSGKYGDTYLVKFLQEQNIILQPWIKNR